MAKVLAMLASVFTGAGLVSYTPNSSWGETKCPKSLL